MATPLKLVRTAVLDTLILAASGGTLEGVQAYRIYPFDMDLPRIAMLKTQMDKVQLSKSSYRYDIRVPLEVMAYRQTERAVMTLDEIEEAVDTLLDNGASGADKLTIDGYTVHEQFFEDLDEDEALDSETGASLDVSTMTLLLVLT